MFPIARTFAFYNCQSAITVSYTHLDVYKRQVANRIGLTNEKDVLTTEKALMEALPENRWSHTHHSLISVSYTHLHA